MFYQFVVLLLRVGSPLVVKLTPESEGLGVVDLVSAPFYFSSVAARQLNLNPGCEVTVAVEQKRQSTVLKSRPHHTEVVLTFPKPSIHTLTCTF